MFKIGYYQGSVCATIDDCPNYLIWGRLLAARKCSKSVTISNFACRAMVNLESSVSSLVQVGFRKLNFKLVDEITVSYAKLLN